MCGNGGCISVAFWWSHTISNVTQFLGSTPCKCAWVCIFVCTCVYSMCLCVSVHVYTCIHYTADVHTSTHLFIHVLQNMLFGFTCMCVSLCVCVYMYVCVCAR